MSLHKAWNALRAFLTWGTIPPPQHPSPEKPLVVESSPQLAKVETSEPLPDIPQITSIEHSVTHERKSPPAPPLRDGETLEEALATIREYNPARFNMVFWRGVYLGEDPYFAIYEITSEEGLPLKRYVTDTGEVAPWPRGQSGVGSIIDFYRIFTEQGEPAFRRLIKMIMEREEKPSRITGPRIREYGQRILSQWHQ